jgi:hypothetical protein
MDLSVCISAVQRELVGTTQAGKAQAFTAHDRIIKTLKWLPSPDCQQAAPLTDLFLYNRSVMIGWWLVNGSK